MRTLLIRWIFLALIIGVVASFVPGVSVEGGFGTLLAIALVFGLVNAFIRPLVTVLTCPLVILTLGLFAIVINTLMFLLTAWIYPGLKVDGFLPALFASLLISVASAGVTTLIKGRAERSK